MLYLLGTDEAGYGPNLGPLVVAATLWKIHDADFPSVNEPWPDLYESLATGISSDPSDETRLPIADSKQLYLAGTSLALLEQGVLAALQLLRREAVTWRRIWQCCAPGLSPELPWHRTFDCALPWAIGPVQLASVAQRLKHTLESAKVELVDLRATILHPAEFNDRCQRLESKGAVLSTTTLSLASELLQHCDDAPALIVCDKHGGRNRYAGMVWDTLVHSDDVSAGFPVQTLRESREESIYRWRHFQPREIRFITQGERFLPAALASMTAKYLRELSMLAFNAFWAERVPNLKPTAGYPGDALRFWNDIEPAVRLARFSEHELWRAK
jgi:hypothetical protein